MSYKFQIGDKVVSSFDYTKGIVVKIGLYGYSVLWDDGMRSPNASNATLVLYRSSLDKLEDVL